MKKAENKLRLLIVMVMSMMLFLAACGGSSKSDTSSSMDMVAETMAASAMPESAVTAVNGLSSGTGAMISEGISGGSLEGGALEDAAEIEETVSEGMERKLIRTIDMEVQTRDFDSALSSIQQQAEKLGGYIESSWQSGAEGYTDRRSANITVRMPAEHTDEFLNTALSNMVVTYRSERTEDVTLKYTDLEARMEALRVEQERLTELLSEADSIESVIAIESRLSDVRYELESIGSQLRNYDNLVSFDTISIGIAEVKVLDSSGEASFGERIRTGLAKNTEALRDGLEDLAVSIITNLPLILLILIAAGVIFALIRLVTGIASGSRAKKRSSLSNTGKAAEEKQKSTSSNGVKALGKDKDSSEAAAGDER